MSRAAQRLSLTQPTVSAMLSRLRNLFDDPLFVRTRHGMLPTPRAEALAPALEQLLKDATKLVTQQHFNPATVEMDLRVSVNDYMQSTLVVPFAKKLRRDAPKIRLSVRNLEIAHLGPMLARSEIDMAITIPEFTDSSVHTQFLYREEYVCVVRKSHPIRSSKVSMKRFLSYEHVLVSPSDGAFHGPADEALAARGFKRRVALSVPGFLVLLEILQIDDFIALVPKRLLSGHTHSLRTIRAPLEVPGFDVVAAWHPRTHQDSAHQWLRSRLANIAGQFGSEKPGR